MDIESHAKLGHQHRMHPAPAAEPNSLIGRLLELTEHLERQGHISPIDRQLILTIINHPEMPIHLRRDESRPSYTMSEGYEGPVDRCLA